MKAGIWVVSRGVSGGGREFFCRNFPGKFFKKNFRSEKIFGKILKKFKEFFYLTEEKRELICQLLCDPIILYPDMSEPECIYP